jgi:hypothetical protein
MSLCDLFRKKPKAPETKTIATCSKHGPLGTHYRIITRHKEYHLCLDCVGEFASQHVTTEEVEV